MKKLYKNYQGRNFKKVRTPDKLSRKIRSYQMSKIRSRGTKFELDFILKLRKSSKNKFQTNVSSIRGKLDIVFRKKRICVFLDSDFWHGWQYPRWKHLLKDDFWRKKIENNRKRDLKTTKYLIRNGWKVLRVWEHNLPQKATKIIEQIRIWGQAPHH